LRKAQVPTPEGAASSNPRWVEYRQETRNVAEAGLDDLVWADAIVLGTPTRYGLSTAWLKQFIDRTGPCGCGRGEILGSARG
jgi:NAD(P)H dehydrogenase (quinone)